MSPEAGNVLINQIIPRLKTTVPRWIRRIGAEDEDELLQDATVMAAQMLHNVEVAGKTVTPGNIVYYTLLHLKSGHRSQCRSRADVLAGGTQLDQKSSVLSLEEEVGYDPELNEAIPLSEYLASSREDPADAAARNMDWREFLGPRDPRYRLIAKGFAEGKTLAETVRETGHGYSRIVQIKERMAGELKEFMGDEAVADSARVPGWRASVKASSERAACSADRRKG